MFRIFFFFFLLLRRQIRPPYLWNLIINCGMLVVHILFRVPRDWWSWRWWKHVAPKPFAKRCRSSMAKVLGYRCTHVTFATHRYNSRLCNPGLCLVSHPRTTAILLENDRLDKKKHTHNFKIPNGPKKLLVTLGQFDPVELKVDLRKKLRKFSYRINHISKVSR